MSRTESGQRHLDLGQPEVQKIALVSPKRTPRDSQIDGKLPWGLAYAAYSLNFASMAVRELAEKRKRTIVDPFVGSGTTVSASLMHGCNCIGADLNPYSALTSRARGAQNSDQATIDEIFSSIRKDVSKEKKKDPQLPIKNPVANALRVIAARLNVPAADVLQMLCNQRESVFDNEIIALCSLTHASRLLLPNTRGSNPAWLPAQGHVDGELLAASSIIATAQTTATAIRNTLANQEFPSTQTWTRISNTDFSTSKIPSQSISRFLTSPPYLNRLDYVRSNLPEILRLGISGDEKIESLRSQMMGTTKIRKIGDQFPATPSSSLAKNLLEMIRTHPTQASGTYYYRFFIQYFIDLDRFFDWLSKHTTKNAAGFIVVQDSYYKEIKIPLAEIFQEVGERYFFSSNIVSKWEKINHIGQMSPTQRKHAPGKILTESVIFFNKLTT